MAQLSRAAEIVASMILDSESAFAAKPSHGTLRGIDVYPATTLLRTIQFSMDKYEQVTGEPMCSPEKACLFREKIYWSKFFRPMVLPTPADKLAAYSTLPVNAKLQVKEPPKVWQSAHTTLPDNDLVPPGNYYLKTNHASSTHQRVVYPLRPEQRSALEIKAKKWLQWNFGWKGGEWWYSSIRRRLFLEKELDLPQDYPGEFKFHTMNGRVTHLHVNWQTPEGRATSIYDRDLTFLDLTYKKWPNCRRKLSSRVADLAAIAEELARGFDYVRVDLYLDRDDTIWFGELTFSPANARGRYSSREFEIACCKTWDIGKYLRSEPFSRPV
jgi:hypothetical protein